MNDTSNSESVGKHSLLRSILSRIPTLLVLAILAGVGVWGHRTGWKAPKFSDLLGSRTGAAEAEDWCLIHNVPDSRCIACHPELAGESAEQWCKEHGVPEAQCTICHPEILTTGVAGDWCKEHGLPESGCTLCHPDIARPGELPASDSEVVVTHAGESETAEGAKNRAGIRDPSTCQSHAMKVQFASTAAMAKAGIRLGKVVERQMSDSIDANGEVDYDRTKFARISSRVSGTALRIERALGDRVKAGEILALIDSPEIGRAKAEFLQALTAVEVTNQAAARLQVSSAAGFRTETERLAADGAAREAEARLFNARQAIVNLGLPAPAEGTNRESIAALGLPADMANGNQTASSFPLIAPFDGVVVTRSLVIGEVVEPTRTLFEIADTRVMWITTDVPQSESQRLALGQQMIFRPDGADGKTAVGPLAWVSTAVDETTRTIKWRANVDNADGLLRAHAFGRARIVVRNSPKAVAVQNEAIQWEGCCHIVFVRLADEIFQTRKVQVGARDAAFTEVIGGVLPGEVVVTIGSHVLKSEILKSNLGAGCCADE